MDETRTEPEPEQAPEQAPGSTPGPTQEGGGYAVVLLVEDALDEADAARVLSLHEGLDQAVTYRVVIPVEDAAAAVEAALGGLSTGDLLATPATTGTMLDPEDLEAVQDAADRRSHRDLEHTLAALRSLGARATGATVSGPPIDELAAALVEVDGREAIVVTRPHVIAEFFHVDWSAQARRRLGIPVLHLVEHETFDEQAGEGEGVTGV